MQTALIGASGRMGRALIRALAVRANAADKSARLAGALVRKDSPFIGKDAGEIAQCGKLGVKLTDSLEQALAKAEAVIDFSAPETSLACAAYAAKHGLVHIIGTTGFSAKQEKEIAACAAKTVIVKSGNMSLGVNLLAALTKLAAQTLNDEFDIEILEMHHRNKADAPSGTALLLAEAAAKGRAIDLQKQSIYSRSGQTGKREAGAIGFATLRGGSIVGEHSVIFAGEGERLTLSHAAEDRGIFANGAIKAALWARGKPNGLYSMFDVLGLKNLQLKT